MKIFIVLSESPLKVKKIAVSRFLLILFPVPELSRRVLTIVRAGVAKIT